MLRLFTKLGGMIARPARAEAPLPVVERPSPFGYKPSSKPATSESFYSHTVIDDYVRSHVILPKDDALAQAHVEDLYEIYADYISHLPPYRQILMIDGDRPTGDKRYLALGESHVIKRRPALGVYDYYADCLDIKVQESPDKEQEGTPVLRSKADIQGTISHETSHQQDNQITKIDSWNDAWSMQSENWATAIQQEIASGNVGTHLQALLPETEIVLHKPYYQYPSESKAEFEKLFCLVYSKMDGDFGAASNAMNVA